MSESTAKFRVAICGGGIGGLTLAAVLGRFAKDVQVDIYESDAEFNEIGAGISVWRRTWRIMEIAGLEKALLQLAIQPPTDIKRVAFTFRKSDEPQEGINFLEMMVSHGPITVHRADFLKILTDAFPNIASSHFCKRLVDYKENDNGTTTLHFEDGTTAETDVLIGSDGIDSVTRKTMYFNAAKKEEGEKAKQLSSFIEPTWSGTVAFRSLAETKKVLEANPNHRAATTPGLLMYCGKNKHIVSYPISMGRLINFVAFVTFPDTEGTDHEGPAVRSASKEEMLSHFKDWEPEVATLMETANPPLLWAVSALRDMPFYVKGRVALLGDAAHAMTTHLGAGAGQAIEDAHILGRILADSRVTLDNIEAALQIYDSVRRPLGNGVVEGSRSMGFLYELNGPGSDDGANMTEDELRKVGEKINDQWRWQWETIIDEDWALAEKKLQELHEIHHESAEAVA